MQVRSISLLSKDEYECFKSIIPDFAGWWWLRTPYSRQNQDVFVVDGNRNELSCSFCGFIGNIRPMCEFTLDISDDIFWHKPEQIIGKKIAFGEYAWTILGAETGEVQALCDNEIDCGSFDLYTNEWDASDLKEWLETEGLKRIQK